MRALWEEIKAVDTSKKALRSFGWVVGLVLIGIAAFIWWRKGWVATGAVQWLGGIGGVLTVLGLTVPTILLPVYRVWMALAVVLGFVMTRVILSVVFYLIMTPIGLIMRLLGKDPMERTLKPEDSSYWIKKEYRDDSGARMEKYY